MPGVMDFSSRVQKPLLSFNLHKYIQLARQLSKSNCIGFLEIIPIMLMVLLHLQW
jgi:hypothetical protein